jgi:hypothetical protein
MNFFVIISNGILFFSLTFINEITFDRLPLPFLVPSITIIGPRHGGGE